MWEEIKNRVKRQLRDNEMALIWTGNISNGICQFMKQKIGGDGRGHLANIYCIPSALYIITINILTNTTESAILLFFRLEKGGVPFWLLQSTKNHNSQENR